MSDSLFLAEVRTALRVEMAGVRVGVAAPQLRGRIAARERDRHRRRLRLSAAVAAIAGVAAAIPIVVMLVLPAAVGPSPGGVQPASVAAIDPESGDLVLAWAWPDGRAQAGFRYPGALAIVDRATGGASPDRLPRGAVLAPGPDGRLAVALPGGDILVYRSPAGRGALTRVVDGPVEETWLGWADDGRLVTIGRPFAAPDARLRMRIVDPDTGRSVEGTLRYGTSPLAPGALLTWTDQGAILARHRSPRTGAITIGLLSVAGGRASFDAGLPARVRVTTGLEPALARDGSVARGWSGDGGPPWSSVGVGRATDDDAVAARWYAAAGDEQIVDVVRSADLLRLVALVAKGDGTSARIVVVDWPGTWRDAVVLPGPGAGSPSDPGAVADMAVVGLAPDGRTIAVGRGGTLVIADLATGAAIQLPPGSAFLGWPEPTVAVTEALPTAPACAEPSSATAASITLAVAGTRAPADSGARPVVGDRADPDPWRREWLATVEGVEVAEGEPLVLALPVGSCVEAFRADAVAIGSAPGAAVTRLGGKAGGGADVAGLLELVAPPAGDWVVRVTVWLAGADREAILLYHVRTIEPRAAGPSSHRAAGPSRRDAAGFW